MKLNLTGLSECPCLSIDCPKDDTPVRIIDKLFVGSVLCSYDLLELQRLGITHVLNFCGDPFLYADDFVTMEISIKDEPTSDFLSLFRYTCGFMHCGISEGAVFVYCRGGRSRSITAVAAYLLLTTQMSLPEILRYLKEKRHVMSINPGFLSQLKVLEGIKLKMMTIASFAEMISSLPTSSNAQVFINNYHYGNSTLTHSKQSSQWHPVFHANCISQDGTERECRYCLEEYGISLCNHFSFVRNSVCTKKRMPLKPNRKNHSIFDDQEDNNTLDIPVMKQL